MTSHIDLTLTLGQDLWISEHFMWHRLLKHFFPGSSQIFWFLSLCSQHSPSEQIPLLQIKCFLQVITNHCKPFSFLTISYQQEIFLCTSKTKFSPQVWFYHWLRDFLQHTPINVLTNSQICQINCVVLSKIFNAKLCLQGWSREELILAIWLSSYFF